ncbi:MAG: hypothetical protein K1X44_04375 [Alphaproteobacteria bacterium]|nr:hypothetical protein [Alphaproteobacteria bacterium]
MSFIQRPLIAVILLTSFLGSINLLHAETVNTTKSQSAKCMRSNSINSVNCKTHAAQKKAHIHHIKHASLAHKKDTTKKDN